MALSVLRLIEEESMKDRTGRIIAQLPVDIATYLLNEKRAPIAELESRFLVAVTLVPNETLQSPNFEITRVRQDHLGQDNNSALSYRIASDFSAESRAALTPGSTPGKALVDEPAVKSVLPVAPLPSAVPVMQPAAGPGALSGFWIWLKTLFGIGVPKAQAPPPPALPKPQPREARGNSRSQETRRDRDRGDSQRERGSRQQDGQRRERGEGRSGRSEDGREARRDGRGSEARAATRSQPNREAREGRDGNRERGRDAGPRQNTQPRPAPAALANRNDVTMESAPLADPAEADEAIVETGVQASAAGLPESGERDASRRRRGRRGRGRGGRADGPREGELDAGATPAGYNGAAQSFGAEDAPHSETRAPVHRHGRASEFGADVPEFGGSLPQAAELAPPLNREELAAHAEAPVPSPRQSEMNLPHAESHGGRLSSEPAPAEVQERTEQPALPRTEAHPAPQASEASAQPASHSREEPHTAEPPRFPEFGAASAPQPPETAKAEQDQS